MVNNQRDAVVPSPVEQREAGAEPEDKQRASEVLTSLLTAADEHLSAHQEQNDIAAGVALAHVVYADLNRRAATDSAAREMLNAIRALNATMRR